MANYHGPNIQPVIIAILREPRIEMSTSRGSIHTSRNHAQDQERLIRVSPPLTAHRNGWYTSTPPHHNPSLCPAGHGSTAARKPDSAVVPHPSAGCLHFAQPLPSCLHASTDSIYLHTRRFKSQTQPSLSCRSSQSRRYRWLHPTDHDSPARRPLIDRPSKPAGLDGMTCFSSPSLSP